MVQKKNQKLVFGVVFLLSFLSLIFISAETYYTEPPQSTFEITDVKLPNKIIVDSNPTEFFININAEQGGLVIIEVNADKSYISPDSKNYNLVTGDNSIKFSLSTLSVSDETLDTLHINVCTVSQFESSSCLNKDFSFLISKPEKESNSYYLIYILIILGLLIIIIRLISKKKK